MKRSKFYRIIAVRIIVTCILAMVASFVADYLQKIGFFGDYYTYSKYSGREFNYAWRHYVYNFTGFALFVLSVVRTIDFITTEQPRLVD